MRHVYFCRNLLIGLILRCSFPKYMCHLLWLEYNKSKLFILLVHCLWPILMPIYLSIRQSNKTWEVHWTLNDERDEHKLGKYINLNWLKYFDHLNHNFASESCTTHIRFRGNNADHHLAKFALNTGSDVVGMESSARTTNSPL